jgi:hypothetical protein
MNDASDPAGGWRYKIGADGLFAITGVVGLSVGVEAPNGITAYTGGVFAPVGIAYSHTSCWSFYYLDTSDCTWMFNLFDFGGLYSYSQQNAGPGYIINTTPRSSLAAALSVGLTYYHRFGQSPFVYGITYEYSPDLRTVTYANGMQTNVSTHRILLFVGVDLVLHAYH